MPSESDIVCCPSPGPSHLGPQRSQQQLQQQHHQPQPHCWYGPYQSTHKLGPRKAVQYAQAMHFRICEKKQIEAELVQCVWPFCVNWKLFAEHFKTCNGKPCNDAHYGALLECINHMEFCYQSNCTFCRDKSLAIIKQSVEPNFNATQLGLLLHARKCCQPENALKDDQNNNKKSNKRARMEGNQKSCLVYRGLLAHMAVCPHVAGTCIWPDCLYANLFLDHWDNCSKANCTICVPLLDSTGFVKTTQTDHPESRFHPALQSHYPGVQSDGASWRKYKSTTTLRKKKIDQLFDSLNANWHLRLNLLTDEEVDTMSEKVTLAERELFHTISRSLYCYCSGIRFYIDRLSKSARPDVSAIVNTFRHKVQKNGLTDDELVRELMLALDNVNRNQFEGNAPAAQ